MNRLELLNISKIYSKQKVLNNFCYVFDKNRLYAITGESGSGKSTILKIISGNISFKGKVILNGIEISKLTDRKLDDNRIKNFGIIYQDFRLFEEENVINNVLIPSILFDKNDAYLKANDLLKLVGLYRKRFQKVSTLSGGEKQRVAIARSLINNPSFVLADEPTGALDVKNANKIMEILKNISNKIPVILVSHDIDLVNKFCDVRIDINEGRIIKKVELNNGELNRNLLLKQIKKEKIPTLSTSFLLKHSITVFKKNKFKNVVSFLITSFSLLSIGLCFMMKTIVSSNIKNTYSMLIGEERLNASIKKQNQSLQLLSPSYEECLKIKENFKSLVNDVGFCYQCDYESYFKDLNEFIILNSFSNDLLNGYSIRSINDYMWLDDVNETIYPSYPVSMENDEIIISLNEFSLANLCQSLYIPKKVESLSEYIKENDLRICLNVKNTDWTYEDEQIFKVVGFVLKSNPCFIHKNHLWNKIVFEEMMLLKTNDNISEVDYYPWYLKKYVFFQTVNHENFLKKIRYENDYSYYVFSLATEDYFQSLYEDENPDSIDRLICFICPKYGFDLSKIKYMEKCESSLGNYLIGTDNGYVIYEDAFLMGFRNSLYVSFSESLIDETIGLMNAYDNQGIVEEKGISFSNYATSSFNGFQFKLNQKEMLYGSFPTNINEICLSDELVETLGENINCVGKDVYLSYPYGEYKNKKGQTLFLFRNCKIKVSGIYKGYGYKSISHNSDWLIDFFLLKVGISGLTLIPKIISFQVAEINESSINNLSLNFKEYSFSNPTKEINSSIDYASSYLEIIFLILSIITISISVLLSIFSSYIDCLENASDVYLLRSLGIRKKESLRIVKFPHFLLICLSFIFASIELICIFYLLSFQMNKNISTAFPIFPFLLMFLISLFLYLTPLLIFRKYFKKFDIEKRRD